MSLTFYGVLRVPRAATVETIKAAYYEQARDAHPDRGGSHEAMAALTQAWSMLKDPVKRKSYDAMLVLMGVTCDRCKGEGQTYKQKGFHGRTAVFCGSCNGEGFTSFKKGRNAK